MKTSKWGKASEKKKDGKHDLNFHSSKWNNQRRLTSVLLLLTIVGTLCIQFYNTALPQLVKDPVSSLLESKKLICACPSLSPPWICHKLASLHLGLIGHMQ